MSVQSVSNVLVDKQPQKINNTKNKNSYTTNYLKEYEPNKSNVAFGSAANGVKNGLNKVFKFIDNSSFFVEFLIVDTLSMVLPRVWIGLNRDKEQLGHLNYKAGAEEAGRECTSGPSMNLIPMGILAGASAAKPASRMERSTMGALNESMKKVIEKSGISDGLNKKLAAQIFDDTYKNISTSSKDKEVFVELLTNSTQKKPKKEMNKIASEFVSKVSELNNRTKNSIPANSKIISFNNETINAKNLFDDFGNYSKDIVAKISQQKGDKKASIELLDKLKQNRSTLKLATALAAFGAVGAFLSVLPKLYQQKGLSPAQESVLRAKGELPDAQNSDEKSKKPSFKGKSPAEFFKLDRGGPMNRGLFVLNAFTFLLASRLFTARDKDEKREIIIRDIPTILISVLGVPMIEKMVAKASQKASGFAITAKEGLKDVSVDNKSFLDKIVEKFKPSKNTVADKAAKSKIKMASYENINEWYKYDKALDNGSGLKGFSQRLDDLGANVKKVYSTLNKDIAEKLSKFGDDNATFIKQLSQDKKLSNTIKNELAQETNNALKTATFKKTVTKMSGFGITLALIGIVVPKLNIAITKFVHRNDDKQTKA